MARSVSVHGCSQTQGQSSIPTRGYYATLIISLDWNLPCLVLRYDFDVIRQLSYAWEITCFS
jgi:hypothetical protein